MITTAEEFVSLCLSDSPEIRRRAKLDEVPEDVLLEVLDKHPDLTDCVIWNNFVSMRILDMLSESPDSHTRFSVSMKNKLSPELIEKLSQDEHESVRHQIVCNRRTPEYILRRLAEELRQMVCIALGELGDPSAIEPLHNLCRSQSWKTRWDAVSALHSLGASCACPCLRELIQDSEISDDLKANIPRMLEDLTCS